MRVVRSPSPSPSPSTSTRPRSEVLRHLQITLRSRFEDETGAPELEEGFLPELAPPSPEEEAEELLRYAEML